MSVRCGRFHLTQIGCIGAQRATLKMSPALYGKGLSLDVAGNESVRLENHVLSVDGPLDPSVDDHTSSLNGTVDERLEIGRASCRERVEVVVVAVSSDK